MSKKKYVIDIDKTICTHEKDYADASPFLEVIDRFNRLYEEGNRIVYFTSRGTETKIDWRKLTEIQLKNWGVKYHELLFGKPSADYYIDDKSLPLDIFNTMTTIIHKEWGHEEIVTVTKNYAIKKLFLKKGQGIHYQLHQKKEETWYIEKGSCVVLIDNLITKANEGNMFTINKNTPHKVIAIENCVILEVSTTELDDVVHLSEDKLCTLLQRLV